MFKLALFYLLTQSLLITAKGNNAQSSLTLLASLVQKNSEQNGFNASAPGQANSTTSKNNFINHCQGKTLTNGLQVKMGSCNGIPMGDIPSTNNIPSAKFISPHNLETIPASQTFNISLKTAHLQTGVFTNANLNYYAAPQALNSAGDIIGHCHVVINSISSLTSTDLADPLIFTFFKGIDDPGVNGISTATVTGGVPAGTYRLCSINTGANHAPALAPVAQHNSLDDCVYFTASDDVKGGGKGSTKTKSAPMMSVTTSNSGHHKGQNNQGGNKMKQGRRSGRRKERKSC